MVPQGLQKRRIHIYRKDEQFLLDIYCENAHIFFLLPGERNSTYIGINWYFSLLDNVRVIVSEKYQLRNWLCLWFGLVFEYIDWRIPRNNILKEERIDSLANEQYSFYMHSWTLSSLQTMKNALNCWLINCRL